MRLSVIIPAYNRAAMLPATLRSLLAQTVPADEVIVVDDGSIDGTAQVAEAFGDPVRVIRQENAGPGAARNAGFRVSSGEFIHFFDSDDLALPNKHEVQLDALARSAADIAYGPWLKGRISRAGFHPEDLVLQQRGLPNGNLVKALLCHWSIVPHACIFRRSIVERAGGFPTDLFVGEDQLMFLRCLLAGAKVVHSPGTLELYRTNDPFKLTAPHVAAKVRHHRDWARFLLMAAAVSREAGFEPNRWLGFRARAWQAHQDLVGCNERSLLEALEAIFRTKGSGPGYRLHRLAGRKWGGLKKRLTGGRAPASFRSGKIDPQQRALIDGLDFNPEHCHSNQCAS